MSGDDNKRDLPRKETAREAAERLIRTDPRFKEAPKAGTGFVIGGAKMPTRHADES